ncbi:MAG: alkaline phosphatase family protein, partial [Archangium sp.]|nr:alkaline phosphatase family protein [Archangium sp.]
KLGVANAVLAVEETDVYLDLRAIADKKLDGAVVRRAAAAFLAKLPDVALAMARDDLASVEAAGFGAALRHGWYPERSGDVVMVLKPVHVLESEPRGTSHGTPYSYDSEVPLLLAGKGVRSGVFPVPVRAIDVAPTLAALLELGTPASCEGRAVSDVLSLGK